MKLSFSKFAIVVLLMFIVVWTITQCAPDEDPQLGDSKARDKDGQTMVFVPAGEFMMGIDHIGMRYAIQLCKEVKEEVGPGTCQGTSFANEMPAHGVHLDGFWVDRTEDTNQNICFVSKTESVLNPLI